MTIFNTPDNEHLHTLETLKTPGIGRILARWLMGIFIVALAGMFLPWQQNVRGKGTVTAFTPANRPQFVESIIPGRIAEWYVNEGDFIEKGDTILLLTETKDKYFNPALLERYRDQLDAKTAAIENKKRKAEALQRQLKAIRESMDAKLQLAKNKVKQARFILTSDSIDYEAEKVRYTNALNQYERNKGLYEIGNIALTKFQEIESKYQEARMKRVSAENKWLKSKTDLVNAKVDIAAVEAEYLDKLNKTESDLSATLAELYESEANLSKSQNEYANLQIRAGQYQVTAPQSGYVVKVSQSGIGETIKAGEAIASILPENPDVAVALYIEAMNVPLISPGRKVRIEFDGWPALQFSGWPSVAVGTFGGQVKVIDRVNSKGGYFRLLVTPDPEEEPWPEQIRLGSGAKGWVMLDDVPVWYELWRQLNGFPPSLYEPPAEVNDKVKGKK